MGSLSPWHWAIVILVFVVLFGSKRLPDAARGLGRSLRIFKAEVQDLKNDDRRVAPVQPENTSPVQASVPLDPPPQTGSTVTPDPDRRSA